MHLGFRYHLASLMAVFFSLVLGILVGGALFQDSALVAEQGLLISEMEEHFAVLRANLAALEDQLEFSDLVWAQLKDLVIKDKLHGKTLVLVEMGSKRDWDPLRHTLEKAGAQCLQFKVEELPEMERDLPVSFLFKLDPLTELGPLLPPALSAERGPHLAFVWTTEQQPEATFLPPASLQIDCVDTIWGEIALVLGLAGGAQGHYGISAGARGLFP